MSGRGLDHLIEQNETELSFLSQYGGGETSDEIMTLLKEMIVDGMKLTKHDDGVQFTMSGSLPLVPSDVQRRGFMHGELSADGVSVVITDLGPEQRRFVERPSRVYLASNNRCNCQSGSRCNNSDSR